MLKTDLSQAEQARYSRQIILPEITQQGQLKLTQSHAVIFGLGGLGSPVSMYLAAAGIGKLTLVDFDEVDDSNLQRQIVHNEKTVGQAKVESAKQHLQQLNSLIEIQTYQEKPSEEEVKQLIADADVVLECTDNFASRFSLNRACVELKKPLVSGAAIRWEGQLATYDYRREDSPCYQCLYKSDSGQELTCQNSGIAAPVVGMLGTMQAVEAMKVILGLPTLAGKLLIVDAITMQFRTLQLGKDPSCETCGE